MATLETEETARARERERGGQSEHYTHERRREEGLHRKANRNKNGKKHAKTKKKERRHAARSGKQVKFEGMEKTKNGICGCVSLWRRRRERIRGCAAGRRGSCVCVRERGHKTSASLCVYLSPRATDKEEQKERGREGREGREGGKRRNKKGRQIRVKRSNAEAESNKTK